MATLFDKLKIGDLELNNRIVLAPMTRSRADDDGIQPDYAAEYYAQRASGGLLITEAVNVSPMAKGYVRTPGTPIPLRCWRPIPNQIPNESLTLAP